MKILVLSPGIPSALNSGLGIAANAINKALADRATVTVIQPDNTLPELEEEHTVSVDVDTSVFSTERIAQQEIEISVSARFDPYHYGIQESAITSARENFSEITAEIDRYTTQVLTKIKKLKYDLVYAHDWVTFETALAIKEKSGIPFVAHVHSLDYDRGAKRYRSFVFDIEKESLSKADAIIAVSAYTRKVLIKQYGIASEKIAVVHNGVTPFEVPSVKKLLPEKIILFVGRLSVQKGPGIFIEIAERLASKRKDVRFIVAGDGDLFIELVEQSAKSPDVKFHFTGYCSFDEIKQFYAMADVLCMPSVSEPFGLAAVEAAWAGLPVVLSDHAGAAEVLRGAWLANPEKPATFVDQIDQLLGDPDRAKKSVEENIDSLQGQTWGNVSEKIISVFITCLKE